MINEQYRENEQAFKSTATSYNMLSRTTVFNNKNTNAASVERQQYRTYNNKKKAVDIIVSSI